MIIDALVINSFRSNHSRLLAVIVADLVDADLVVVARSAVAAVAADVNVASFAAVLAAATDNFTVDSVVAMEVVVAAAVEDVAAVSIKEEGLDVDADEKAKSEEEQDDVYEVGFF